MARLSAGKGRGCAASEIQGRDAVSNQNFVLQVPGVEDRKFKAIGRRPLHRGPEGHPSVEAPFEVIQVLTPQIHRPIVKLDERAVGIADETLWKRVFDIRREWRQDADGVVGSVLLVVRRKGCFSQEGTQGQAEARHAIVGRAKVRRATRYGCHVHRQAPAAIQPVQLLEPALRVRIRSACDWRNSTARTATQANSGSVNRDRSRSLDAGVGIAEGCVQDALHLFKTGAQR